MESRKRAPHSKTGMSSKKRTPTSATNRQDQIQELMKNRMYETQEVSGILGISNQSLRRAIEAGKIKTVRIGHFLRITSKELDRLLQGESVWLSIQEASDYLKISPATIRSLIKEGKIKAFRLTDSGPFKISQTEIIRISKEGI